MKTRIAYISGPISGLSNGNFDAFTRAQRKLEHDGYIVVNPHEIGKAIYDKWATIARPESNVDGQKYDNEMWAEFVKNDIRYLVTCDCVMLLDNWEQSRGCRVEIFIAQKLMIPIYYMRNYELFDVTFDIVKQNKIPM